MKYTRLLRQGQELLIKTSIGNPTGLTGILQHPEPRPTLIKIYQATIKNLKDKFPDESIYKKSTLSLTQKRLEIVEKEEIVANIENQIGSGLIEELIIQANDEFELSNQLLDWKCWESLQEAPLEDQWVYFGKKIWLA